MACHLLIERAGKAIGKFGILRTKPLKLVVYSFKQRGDTDEWLADINLTELDSYKLSLGQTFFEGHVYAHQSIDDFCSLHPIYMDYHGNNFRTRDVALWRIDTYAMPFPWYTDPYFDKDEKWIFGNSFRTPNNIPINALKLFKFGDLYVTSYSENDNKKFELKR
jgi:hypothetical protein